MQNCQRVKLHYIRGELCEIVVRGELSPDQVEPLRAQLLQLINSFAGGPRIVLTRLCIAVSCCLLLMDCR